MNEWTEGPPDRLEVGMEIRVANEPEPDLIGTLTLGENRYGDVAAFGGRDGAWEVRRADVLRWRWWSKDTE